MASSPDEGQNVNYQLLHLHLNFRSFLCNNCDDSVLTLQKKQRPEKLLHNVCLLFFCLLFCFRLYVLVNNFSVISGQLPGFNQ